MNDKRTFNTVIGWILAVTSVTFVLLLAGFGSGTLTDSPPAISPYATGTPSETDVLEPGTSAPDAAASDSAAPAVITIEGFDFGDSISAATGQIVTVTNRDGVAHTWTARDGTFDSSSIASDGSFDFTFDEPGEYDFFCSIHPSMTGSISVQG